MHFALATTQGGRPTTVTTAAMSNDSPRTSAVPAPTSYLPHAVPSTSQGVGATSADASTGPNSDDLTAGGSQITMEDYNDTSSEDEYQKSGSTFTMALGHYFFERNLIETPNNYQASKPVIDYVNLKFVENNFRTLGLDEMFDKNNIRRAETEFESFEVWFSHLKKYAADREYIRDLRLPLFCHLYLNLYAPHNHARLQAFLKTFKYLFASPKGNIYLEELRNVTDILNLSPRLEYFRRNKFVYGVSPMFVNRLYDFFQINFMLQVVFQEWIDINYITYEDPRIVFDEKCTNNQEQVNNLDEANAPKTLNLSQNKNINRKVNNSKNDISNEGRKSRKHRKKHKLRRKKKSTSDNNSHKSSNETSNNDEQLQKKIKSSDRRKTTGDQNSRSCEKSFEISDDDYKEKKCKRQNKSNGSKSTNDDNNMQMSESLSEVSDSEQKKYKSQKNSGRCKSTNYDNNTQMKENLSEVSDGEKKKYRRQKIRGKNKSISDDNMHISNDDEKKQKRQNKRSKTKSTSDDNNRMSEISSDEQKFQKPQNKKKLRGKKKSDHNIDDSSLCGSSPEDITTILMIIIFLMMSKNQESSNKDKEIHKSNARRKYELINSNTSLSESCSAGDSLEDSSSLYSSSCDEELLMRKYMRKIKKSTQYLRYETSHYLKPIKVTKINLKTLDEDLYLHLSRKIILKNCGKVSCSFLTSDQNLVVAGSVDALIYLWERDNEQSVSEESHDVLHTIGNINSSTFSSSVQENNLVEYLDKSKAFILRGHGGPIFDLAELPSAKILLSASDDKTYRAWDLRTKQCIEIYNGHEHRTWCIAASPYSLQVATGSCEGASCLWFLNYKRPLRMFIGHLDDILVLKFHPNQVFLATGSSDKTVRVFELTTGDCHRVLMGHTDYITCLEFNTENFNYLASAAGNGEIIVWDVPSGEIVWRIGVGKVLFSDLVWITKDVLLASLTTGVVLKCDTTLNYIDSSCKVNGFETPFYRLISLQMINNTVYTIGIPDKSGGLKPISKRTKEKALQTKSERQKSQKEPSPLSKLFFPQHIIDNNGNSMTPLRGLSSLIPNPTYDFEYQINTNDQLNKSTLPNFLSMNLKSAPFNLSADEISKLSSEYQSKNIRLIPASDITNNLRNAYLLPVQKNIRTSNANSVNAHSTNVQLPSTSKSQKLNKTHAPPKSKITKAKQHNFGNSSLTMHTSIQHMQIKTTTAQEQLHLDDHKDTNMLVQQYLQTMGTSTHKQQTSNLLQVKRPGMSSPLLQNSIVQQDQKMQLQHGTGSNSSVAGTNVQQQQLLQQSRSNTNLTKGNVQQRLSPQTNNRSSNVTKRSSSRQSPNKSSSLDDTGTGKHTRMQ
ncbi:uncharacterized protein LOC100569295 isoform X21 [Acyrthosiphon pisum]|uniref:WD repeat-containing protein 55 homolog n=1 Tax=Acyrthosiphon pisum TaxID=7029 RepID=A0A8R2D1D4_ACYPI|nr:uncharacterized protein LOC100569295 isoform X21 [Acyrthosiphon pisum]|eukprot:XP_016656519.1 PREDICTED: uncharacterized protein LOC100569295 isoform X4 [Acyrthosiphon pisum]